MSVRKLLVVAHTWQFARQTVAVLWHKARALKATLTHTHTASESAASAAGFRCINAASDFCASFMEQPRLLATLALSHPNNQCEQCE